MSRISIKISWEVDNGNGIERTLLNADSTTYNNKGLMSCNKKRTAEKAAV